jgi:hypothetical protein
VADFETPYLRGLQRQSESTQGPPPPPETEGRDFETPYLRGLESPGQKAEPPGFWSDLGQTVVAKGARGVAAIPGVAGDVAQLFGGPNKYLPTTNDIIAKAGSVAPGIRSALHYQPHHTISRYVGSVAEALPSAVIPLGGGIGLGARMLGGVGSGLAMQGVDDAFKGSSAEGGLGEAGAKLAAGVAGGSLGVGAANALAHAFRSPERIAAERLAAGLSRDIKASGRNATAAMDEAAAAGLPSAALAGKATKGVLRDAAARSSDEAVGSFNTALDAAKGRSRAALDDAVDTIFGRPGLNALDEIDDISRRVKDINNANYTRVMALPEAQKLSTPELGAIAQRLPQNTLRDVFEELRINGVDPASVGLLKTRNGLQIAPGGGSLRLWDEIKQNIDTRIGSLVDPVTRGFLPGKAAQAGSLQNLKSNLIDTLDDVVKPYKQIRFEGSQLYQSRNAVEAGYKLFSDLDAKSIHAKRKFINNLSATQKDDLALGFAGAFKDALAKDPASALRMFAGAGGQFNIAKMNTALGPDRARDLIGSISQQQLTLGLQSLQQHPGFLQSIKGTAKDYGKSGGLGLLGAAAGEALLVGGNIMQVANMALTPGMAIGAIVGMAGRKIYNIKEAKIGEQVLRLASDPARTAELGRLIQRNPDARSFLAKTIEVTARVTPPAGSTTLEDTPAYKRISREASGADVAPPLTIPVGRRASGGRIERAAGGRTMRLSDRLLMAVERARRETQDETKPMLNAPDETVVKALEMAKQHI